MPKELIAVIDDDPAFLSFMRELLEDEDYRPILWRTTAAAMDMLKREQPAAVVLDSWLERRESGRLLFQQIRLDAATSHIPVILCSADHKALERAALLGDSHAYVPLQKPFDITEFLTTLRVALTQDSSQEAINNLGCGVNPA